MHRRGSSSTKHNLQDQLLKMADFTVPNEDDRKKQQLREFHRRTKQLLSSAERNYLYNILHDYQTHKQVEMLVHHLVVGLDSAPKLDLLKDVRNFVPVEHLHRFDRLAPYHKMAHPLRLQNHTQSLPRPRPRPSHKRSATLQPMSLQSRDLAGEEGHTTSSLPRGGLGGGLYATASLPRYRRSTSPRNVNTEGSEVVSLCIVRDINDQLGFSIRGGSEHGLGIYVSELDPGSAADSAGLCLGDNIIEVNNVNMSHIASSSAVSVLTGSNTLNMTVRRVGKIPGFKFAREKTSWYDTTIDRVVEGNLEDHGRVHHPIGVSYLDGTPDRWLDLQITNHKQFLGFNIRGGREYGLGVYVSRIDPGGLAEAKGLSVGDQIVEVNGESFQTISHAVAVEILRKSKQLIMRIKNVGKYPAYKEIYAEYSWIDSKSGVVTKSKTYRRQQFDSGLITSVPVRTASPDDTQQSPYTEFPRDSHIDTYPSPSSLAAGLHYRAPSPTPRSRHSYYSPDQFALSPPLHRRQADRSNSRSAKQSVHNEFRPLRNVRSTSSVHRPADLYTHTHHHDDAYTHTEDVYTDRGDVIYQPDGLYGSTSALTLSPSRQPRSLPTHHHHQPLSPRVDSGGYESAPFLSTFSSPRDHRSATLTLPPGVHGAPSMGVRSAQHRQRTRSTPNLYVTHPGILNLRGEYTTANDSLDYEQNVPNVNIGDDQDYERTIKHRTGDLFAESTGFQLSKSRLNRSTDNLDKEYFHSSTDDLFSSKYRISSTKTSPKKSASVDNLTDALLESRLDADDNDEDIEAPAGDESAEDSLDDLSGLDALDEVISQQQQQLRPRSQDVVMLQRPLELPGQSSSTGRSGKSSGGKKSGPPRSKLGVLALQAEALATPEGQEHLRKQREQQQIEEQRKKLLQGSHQSMLENNKDSLKKNRSLREKIMGTFQGRTGKKTKARAPLTNLSFKKKSKSRESLTKDSIILIQNEEAVTEIERKAKLVLTPDETLAIMRHIHAYKNDQNILVLVTPLLSILDTKEKADLLHIIREVISEEDRSTYDKQIHVHISKLQQHDELQIKTDKQNEYDSGLSSSSSQQPSSSTSNLIDAQSAAFDPGITLSPESAEQSQYYEDSMVPGGPLDVHAYEIRRPTGASKAYQTDQVSTTQHDASRGVSTSELSRGASDISRGTSDASRGASDITNSKRSVSQESDSASLTLTGSMTSVHRRYHEQLPQSDYIEYTGQEVYRLPYTTSGGGEGVARRGGRDSPVFTAVQAETFDVSLESVSSDRGAGSVNESASIRSNSDYDYPSPTPPPPPPPPPLPDGSFFSGAGRRGEIDGSIAGDDDSVQLVEMKQFPAEVKHFPTDLQHELKQRVQQYSSQQNQNQAQHSVHTTQQQQHSVQHAQHQYSVQHAQHQHSVHDSKNSSLQHRPNTPISPTGRAFALAPPYTGHSTIAHNDTGDEDEDEDDGSQSSTPVYGSYDVSPASTPHITAKYTHTTHTTHQKQTATSHTTRLANHTSTSQASHTSTSQASHNTHGSSISLSGYNSHASHNSLSGVSTRRQGSSPPRFIAPPPPDSTPPPIIDNSDTGDGDGVGGGDDWSRAVEWHGVTDDNSDDTPQRKNKGSDRRTLQDDESPKWIYHKHNSPKHSAQHTKPVANGGGRLYGSSSVGEGEDILTVTVDNRHTDHSSSGSINIEQHPAATGRTRCVVELDKSYKSLGLSISGGADSKTQPVVKIQKIQPTGAAAHTGVLKAGQQILSIDGESLTGLKHLQVVDLFRKSFTNKREPKMEIVVLI